MFDRMPKIVGSRDLRHAHFQGKLFVRPLGIPYTKLHNKLEVCSSSGFWYTVLRSKCIGGYEFDLSWSRDVIGYVTIRYAIS